MTDVERLQRTFVQGLASDDGFERHGNRRATWDVSRGCENPVAVTRWSRATGLAKNLVYEGVVGVPMMEINFLTPCRRCPVCLRRHAALWRGRAMTEIEFAERTWFGTLTLSPERHFWIDTTCMSRFAEFRDAAPSEKFKYQVKVIGAEVTKYLKRLRKNSGHQFRYLAVVEIHDSEKTSAEMRGRPHLHLLVHEFAGQPLRKALLEQTWQLGFSSWKLAEGQAAAWYISKYISKANDARVRASIGYGSHSD